MMYPLSFFFFRLNQNLLTMVNLIVILQSKFLISLLKKEEMLKESLAVFL